MVFSDRANVLLPSERLIDRVRFVEQPNPEAKIPSQITTALSKIAVYRMQRKVSEYVETRDIEKATQHLQLISTRLFELGESELSKD